MPRGRPRKNPDAAPAPKKTTRRKAKATAANLGFEQQMFLAADKLRKNLEPSDYKHVTLGLIFLRYISTAFEAHHEALLHDDREAAEDPDEYLAENIFWVPEAARWSHLQANARSSAIGTMIDDAMLAIEQANPDQLKNVLPKDYGRRELDSVMLGELVDLISEIGMGGSEDQARDVLGRVYEYFLGGFAGAEGRRGGEFYTPSSVVRTLVSMLEPYKGRVYDPCCGSGGMFVQSEQFVESHGGKLGDIAIYGQESNYTTWRLAKMNLAVRGIGADIRWNNEGSFLRDALKDLRFDTILANPPFNVSEWWNASLEEDPRWQYGKPSAGNANYAWLQHILWHLAPDGMAGVVLANGSMSSDQNGEGDIRRRMVGADVVDCMVALPGQLFYSTQIRACLWFLARNKNPKGWRDRRGEILFIDARKLGIMVDRTRRELTDADVALIAGTYHAWRGEKGAGPYGDIPGFCKSVTLEDVERHGFVLTPGRYVGKKKTVEDSVPFAERFAVLEKTLQAQFRQGAELNAKITAALKLIVPERAA
ncbi:SAM-dependent DNA methyltransferase [Komagataeibacter rhaeticus]|uniref:type I restriction-modification system subunit M n=1 Tax=Komagataeibacter rhaeticus TaxID=215221 RepID=UPI0004DA5F27|nr:class I SAM-dependent DNA methyltransferase [Komagataeibacter rhaeticus]KDU96014.1 DNA methyltransferase [Komagataeibacter rhaeticus AF1]MBL7239175.1 SAM-dependent DNA methyltransferase [Komagataeibacter rhaeticus]PYD53813.1 SAM-dependent DNA methyltransferase [Komagataeibacter rhaeticus]GBQ10201.1 type I DNA methyltransferase M subunit HsdM [Komagataeibacter rhaeticus DSM 16663]